MDVCFICAFAIPTEGPIGKIDVDAEAMIKRLPDVGDLFALRDGVCRDEGGFDVRAVHVFGGFEVPAGDVVDFSSFFVGLAIFVDVGREHVGFLFFRLERVAHKWWIEDSAELQILQTLSPPILAGFLRRRQRPLRLRISSCLGYQNGMPTSMHASAQQSWH